MPGFFRPLLALCRDACSSLLTLAHTSVRMKVFYRYLCHQSLPYTPSSAYFLGSLGKSNSHLLLNNGFSRLKKHFLLYGPEPAPVFCQFRQRGWHSLLCSKRGIELAAPTTYFYRNLKQIAWHRLIFPVSKKKTKKMLASYQHLPTPWKHQIKIKWSLML